MLVVESEANAPVAHSQSIFGRYDMDQPHHVTFPGLREVLYRVDHAALHRPVEPLQVFLGMG